MSLLSAFASLLVAAPFALAPQGAPQEPAAGAKPALLSAAEQTGLRDKLTRFLADDAAHLSATGEQRKKTGRAREKSKEVFDAEWKKFEKKGNLLASMADLRAVFDNCFQLKAPTISLGQLRKETIKEEGLDYSFFLPKTYKADKPMRTLVVVPGAGDAVGKWTKAADCWAQTWDQSAAMTDSIFHVVHVPEGMELDAIPDYNREGAEEEDRKRNKVVFGTFGEVMRNYNVDRNRVFLDFGRGACGFGLRFMTMFPDRFAGAVLRAPSAVDDLRLGSLLGMPLLLLRTTDTAAAVDALKARLEAISPGSTTVLDVTDAYPHNAATGQIEAWLGKQRRNMTPARVLIEPNHDMYNRAYWAKIDTAESLLTTAADKKPRLEVQTDRATNRITVKAVSVERFTLFLNDDIVDLDKEFTIVVNDKALVEKRTRSFPVLREGVEVRYDWEFLFPAKFSTAVPK
jgi:hypothetical protein